MIYLSKAMGLYVPYLSTKGILRSSMKNINVLPEPRPHNLIPNFDNPELMMFSYSEAEEVFDEKFMMFFCRLSSLRSLKYLFMIDVLPVPAEPMSNIGFY